MRRERVEEWTTLVSSSVSGLYDGDNTLTTDSILPTNAPTRDHNTLGNFPSPPPPPPPSCTPRFNTSETCSNTIYTQCLQNCSSLVSIQERRMAAGLPPATLQNYNTIRMSTKCAHISGDFTASIHTYIRT